ncbi:hypothetical protein IJU22_01235 [Candidatus Saccharibacteria bacterium]|nr:hypothetical protein [Candidatus Saccharibacteria bacterium]
MSIHHIFLTEDPRLAGHSPVTVRAAVFAYIISHIYFFTIYHNEYVSPSLPHPHPRIDLIRIAFLILQDPEELLHSF